MAVAFLAAAATESHYERHRARIVKIRENNEKNAIAEDVPCKVLEAERTWCCELDGTDGTLSNKHGQYDTLDRNRKKEKRREPTCELEPSVAKLFVGVTVEATGVSSDERDTE